MSNLLILVAAMLLSLPAIAQDVREERVSFQPGRSGADIRGSIRGYEIVDYLIDARAGQTIEISLKTSNLSSYFNLLQEAISRQSMSDPRKATTMPVFSPTTPIIVSAST
ncbi:hypothetical protein [Neoaquamicrobium sediminum]|uniref:hypothetical protein n=1 Tax=Neoaquamicrobium sediminum TaxID=1849104 RepID=UPI00156409D3|nr:hypothetical protein [Mesorhizobium sediminum]NRC56961.1 hypothetical protein [Mesorhizobium sediminum]